jgi:hypothetical protein
MLVSFPAESYTNSTRCVSSLFRENEQALSTDLTKPTTAASYKEIPCGSDAVVLFFFRQPCGIDKGRR